MFCVHPVQSNQTDVFPWEKVVTEATCSPFTDSLTPWSRVLLENLTGFQLVKKFPAFYGTRKFITAFTSARHVSLEWVPVTTA